MCPAGRAHFAWGGHFVTFDCFAFPPVGRARRRSVDVGDYAGLEFD